MKDDTPAIFISPEGARKTAFRVAIKKGLKIIGSYAHRRAVRGDTGWTASIIYDCPKGKGQTRYVTNDDVARLA